MTLRQAARIESRPAPELDQFRSGRGFAIRPEDSTDAIGVVAEQVFATERVEPRDLLEETLRLVFGARSRPFRGDTDQAAGSARFSKIALLDIGANSSAARNRADVASMRLRCERMDLLVFLGTEFLEKFRISSSSTAE